MSKKRILITGAAGRVGAVLAQAWADRYELFLIDIRQPSYPLAGVQFTLSDVTDIDNMRKICSQADVVIHLAISGNRDDDWGQVAPVNLNGTWSVFQAASERGCQRIVFVSSVMVDFSPQDPYGASKRWGEILAQCYTSYTALSILCLRLGAVVRQDDPYIGIGNKILGYALTHDDLVRLFTASVEAPNDVRYGVFYGISANKPPRFNDEKTRSVLGYDPQENAFEIARQALFTQKGICHLGMRAVKRIWGSAKKIWN